MEKYTTGNGMKGSEDRDFKFIFNPYPLLPLSGNAEDGISGHFGKKDVPMLLAKYGSDVLDSVDFSRNINSVPLFSVCTDPMRRTFSLANQLLQIQLLEMQDWYRNELRKKRIEDDEKIWLIKK